MRSSRSPLGCCFGTLNPSNKFSRELSSKSEEIELLERKFSMISSKSDSKDGLKRSKSLPLKPVACLTSKERNLITQSWKSVKDKAALGERIYCHIFMQKPVLLGLFPFEDATVDRVRDNPEFKHQSMVLAQFLQVQFTILIYILPCNGKTT